MYAENHEPAFPKRVVCGDKFRDLLAAGPAPGGPEVDHDRLSTQVAESHFFPIQRLEEKIRGELPFFRTDLHSRRHERSRQIPWAIFFTTGRPALVVAVLEPPDCADDDRYCQNWQNYTSPDSAPTRSTRSIAGCATKRIQSLLATSRRSSSTFTYI